MSRWHSDSSGSDQDLSSIMISCTAGNRTCTLGFGFRSTCMCKAVKQITKEAITVMTANFLIEKPFNGNRRGPRKFVIR